MMSVLTVFINGVVEGLTEFIPVSSTGHLILLESAFPLHSDNSATFQIAIQLGAILAAFLYYRAVFKEIFTRLDLRSVFKLLVAMFPAFFIGFFAYSWIKEVLFSVETVAMALIVGGILMLVVDALYAKKDEDDQGKSVWEAFSAVSYRQAFQIGCFQVLSLWPGMSRSASTIMGGVTSGLSYKSAADFSFILAVPVIAAATAYDLLKTASLLSTQDLLNIGLGFLVSFVVGLLAIHTVIKWLGRWHFLPFACYRILLGIGVWSL